MVLLFDITLLEQTICPLDVIYQSAEACISASQKRRILISFEKFQIFQAIFVFMIDDHCLDSYNKTFHYFEIYLL